MGAKKFSHTHVWFEEVSFRGFPGKLKSVGRTAAAETVRRRRRRKRTKSNNYEPFFIHYIDKCKSQASLFHKYTGIHIGII